MSYGNNSDADFIKKARKIVEENFSDEMFGVSELAKELGISRSYLHRKIIAYQKLSVSQFIRQIRLKKAKELLRNTSSTVSEIAYNVGFNSVTYFSKCFHDYYGYSPGEVGKREEEKLIQPTNSFKPTKAKKSWLIAILISVVFTAVVILFIIFKPFLPKENELKRNFSIQTKAENERDEKPITENKQALEFYEQGKDYWNRPGGNNRKKAIDFYKKAIEHDNEFAAAYADLAFLTFLTYEFSSDTAYKDSIWDYAEKAIQYDHNLDMSHIAKSAYYRYTKDNATAVDWLKSALEINPKCWLAMVSLAAIYNYFLPDPELRLEYLLKAISLDDRIIRDYDYNALADAYYSLGFFEKAREANRIALVQNPEYIRGVVTEAAFIRDIDGNKEKARNYLMEWYNKDSTTLIVLTRLGYVCYLMGDYKEAYKYFKMYGETRIAHKMTYGLESAGYFGFVLSEVGRLEESEEFFARHLQWVEALDPNNIAKYLSLAALYSSRGEPKKAMEQLKILSNQDYCTYWAICRLKDEPMYENVRELPEFKKIFDRIESNFEKDSRRIKNRLKKAGLLEFDSSPEQFKPHLILD